MLKPVSRTQQTRARRNSARWIIGGIIGAVAVVVGLILLNVQLSSRASGPSVTVGRIWGQAQAPVSIEVFSDFQCSVCARADATLHRLAPQYIDTAKAKVSFRHFAFLGMESQQAAEAAECAGEQQKFWHYAQYLFSHQAGENVGAFAPANLKRFALQVGLEPTAFNVCLDNGKYAATVQQDTQEGRHRGVQGTPTFFIQGQRVVGLPSPAQLATLIERKPSYE
jgi:protein-disulfide isomerase